MKKFKTILTHIVGVNANLLAMIRLLNEQQSVHG